MFWWSWVTTGRPCSEGAGLSDLQVAIPQKGPGEAGGTGWQHPLGGSRLAGARKRILQVLQRGEDLGTQWGPAEVLALDALLGGLSLLKSDSAVIKYVFVKGNFSQMGTVASGPPRPGSSLHN